MTRGNERRILAQCAPALTGVKAGSLLKVDKMVCNDALDLLSSFKIDGVGTKVLCSRGSFSLILVYRDDMLSAGVVVVGIAMIFFLPDSSNGFVYGTFVAVLGNFALFGFKCAKCHKIGAEKSPQHEE